MYSCHLSVRCVSHIAFDLFFTNSDSSSTEHHDSVSPVTTSYELTKIALSLRAIYFHIEERGSDNTSQIAQMGILYRFVND